MQSNAQLSEPSFFVYTWRQRVDLKGLNRVSRESEFGVSLNKKETCLSPQPDHHAAAFTLSKLDTQVIQWWLVCIYTDLGRKHWDSRVVVPCKKIAGSLLS